MKAEERNWLQAHEFEIQKALLNGPEPPDWAVKDPEFMLTRFDLTSDVLTLLYGNQSWEVITPEWLEEHTKRVVDYMQKHEGLNLNHFVDHPVIEKAYPNMFVSGMAAKPSKVVTAMSKVATVISGAMDAFAPKYNPAVAIAGGLPSYVANPVCGIAKMNAKGECTRTFLTDDQMVCYEAKPFAHPGAFDWVLATSKFAGMYYTSVITYGASCSDRGYTYDKKSHPCYPKIAYTAFRSKEEQAAYRKKRQQSYEAKSKAAGIPAVVDVTTWMIAYDCGGFGRLPFIR